MHGMIFAELKNYVEAKNGVEAWFEILKDAGIGLKFYFAILDYPDEEIFAIVKNYCERYEVEVSTLLIDFGQFIGPTMLKSYKALIRPEWRTLELLEKTENNFHRFVTQQHGAHPPKLVCERVAPDKVIINYTSPRRMCALAEGLIMAYSQHYNERVKITHLSCMHKGDEACNVEVKLLPVA